MLILRKAFTRLFRAWKQNDRKVASDIYISGDWLEITPRPPLTAYKHVQHVIITTDRYERNPEAWKNVITLPDGTTADPDVELVDESGKVYKLHPSMCLSSGVGYSASPSLSKDKAYTKIRIRSDKPFQASHVFWENFNLK